MKKKMTLRKDDSNMEVGVEVSGGHHPLLKSSQKRKKLLFHYSNLLVRFIREIVYTHLLSPANPRQS